MSQASPAAAVVNNSDKSRFELEEEGLTAIADYRRQGDTLMITHVESPVPLRGKGTAGRLMTGVVEAARQGGLKITPLCSYAAAFMRRHPEHQDLLG